MKLTKLLLMAFAGSLLFVSCSDDDSSNTPAGAYDNGVLILNQGGFGAGNATVSYISDAFALENNIFATNNANAVLGDTGQDIGLNNDFAYIVLNYSNKIEVVNRYTFVHVATITAGLTNPRYIAFTNGKGYVTNWGDGGSTSDDFVAVIDLGTNTVTSTIAVAEGPERIVEENGKLYVSHKGGYGYGHTVTVINSSNNAVVTTINVGDVPSTMEVDNGNLYVLNEGKPYYADSETSGSLSVISLATNTVTGTINFTNLVHPTNLVIEDRKMYYTVDADIYTKSVSATTLPTAPLLTTEPQGVYGVYSFAVANNHIYVGDAGDYASNGKVYVYSTTGTLEQTFTVGVIPAGFYFN